MCVKEGSLSETKVIDVNGRTRNGRAASIDRVEKVPQIRVEAAIVELLVESRTRSGVVFEQKTRVVDGRRRRCEI